MSSGLRPKGYLKRWVSFFKMFIGVDMSEVRIKMPGKNVPYKKAKEMVQKLWDAGHPRVLELADALQEKYERYTKSKAKVKGSCRFCKKPLTEWFELHGMAHEACLVIPKKKSKRRKK